MHRLPLDYESILQTAYESFLAPGDLALDVGAHVGRHTFPLARQVQPGGRVVAFEPLPACRAELLATLHGEEASLAGTVDVRGEALGDESGRSEFVVATDALAYSGLRERLYDWPTRLERIPVEVRQIDGEFLTGPGPRFIKIDAEGGEYHILRGAIGCLRKFRPVVAFEFGERSCESYGVTATDLSSFWEVHDYALLDIKGDWLGSLEFAHSAREQQLWDYLAVPAENLPLIRRFQAVLRDAYASEVLRLAGVGLAMGEGADWRARRFLPAIPPRGPSRWLARAAAWLLARVGRLVSDPQPNVNQGLLICLQNVLLGLRAADARLAEQEARLRELEAREPTGRARRCG